MRRWFLVIGLLLIAIISAFVVFSITGVIDTPALFWNAAQSISWLEPYAATYSRGLDVEGWMKEQQLEIDRQWSELHQTEEDLQSQKTALEQHSQSLDQREQKLRQQEESLQREIAERRNIQRLAEIYAEMPTEEAARILEEMDQDLVLNILAEMDMRDAAMILTMFPTNLAVSLSKQLGKAPN